MSTTLEISPPLLRHARMVAAAEGTTLRAVVKKGFAQSLANRSSARSKSSPLVTFHVSGMNPEFASAGWKKFRDAISEGRGA